MNEDIVHVRGLQVNVMSEGDATLPTIVFLHGFTGSVSTWQEVAKYLQGKFRIIAIDLIGHGRSAIPEDFKRYRMEEQIADLEAVFEELGLVHFTLVGYSMGGRIALAYTTEYAARVTSLILESASPGLRTEKERMARRSADQKLSERIIKDGIISFVNFWEEIPLFQSQEVLSVERRRTIREERLGQQKLGLANSLLGIGTGSQASYWTKLQSIEIPVLLLTGEIDKKFADISQEMKKYLPFVYHQTVKGAGHAIHVEKPTLFATMIEEYIDKGN